MDDLQDKEEDDTIDECKVWDRRPRRSLLITRV